MLSVVIPTFDSERSLVPTLAMLVPAAMSGVVRDVIVADGRSADATLEVADVAGCNVVGSSAPLAQRLREAAATARAPWLMFLRPGTVLDTTWLDETVNFIEETERGDAAVAAVFRKAVSRQASYPMVIEALSLIKFALIGRAGPDQGLVISTRLYGELGGHRDGAADPEADLLARLGRRRIVMLRSGARGQPQPRRAGSL
jgi:glycosyltransferase involved in cell wall biosynthesis